MKNVSDAEAQNSVSYVGALFANEKIEKLDKEKKLTGYEKKALLQLARVVVANALRPDDVQPHPKQTAPIYPCRHFAFDRDRANRRDEEDHGDR